MAAGDIRNETCVTCGNAFSFVSKQGKPPKRCDTCRANGILPAPIKRTTPVIDTTPFSQTSPENHTPVVIPEEELIEVVELEEGDDPYLTNESFYFGMQRLEPPDPLCPQRTNNYVTLNGDTDELRQVAAKGEDAMLLIGEAGSGKTEFAKEFARQVGSGLVLIPHDAHVEYEDVFGKLGPGPDGIPVFQPGPFTIAAQKGYTVLLDEISAAKMQILQQYFEVCNGAKSLLIRTANGIHIIDIHPRFRIFATCNPWQTYAGSNELSMAFIDRFFVNIFDYPKPEIEFKIVRANSVKLSDEDIESLVGFANEVRNLKKGDPENVKYVTSTRALLRIARLVDKGFTLRRAVECIALSAVALCDVTEFNAVKTLFDATFPTPVEAVIPDPTDGGLNATNGF